MNNNKGSAERDKPGKLLAKISLAILLIVLLIIFFFPKQRVIGGLRGGPIAPGETTYRQDYTCIGIAYDFCPNWPDYGCDYLCFGAVVGRSCSLESYEPLKGVSQAQIACVGPTRPRWGFPGR